MGLESILSRMRVLAKNSHKTTASEDHRDADDCLLDLIEELSGNLSEDRSKIVVAILTAYDDVEKWYS